jgi:hypothetical protein
LPPMPGTGLAGTSTPGPNGGRTAAGSDPAESRAYIQGWLGGTEVTEDNITRVFAAVNKILTDSMVSHRM